MTAGSITNDTELVNSALARLGEAAIADIAGTDDQSTLIASQYYVIRRACLAKRIWRFALQKQQLSKLSSTPVNEFDNAFQLPSDLILGPLAVFDSTAAGVQPFHRWELYGDEILTDSETIVIDYTVDVTDVQRWPSYFVELVVLALCGALAKPITDSETLATEYNARAWGTPQDNYSGGWYRVAAKMDRGTSKPLAWNTADLVAARRGG